MASISSLGIGSGLDLSSLVQGLVAAERDPTLARLAQREAVLQAELSAFGSLKSSLSDLQNALDTLTSVGKGRTAVSGDTGLISVSAADSAAPGNYDVVVTNLATAHSLASGGYADPTDTVGTGTLSITVGGGTPEVFDIDNTNNTLEDVRDAINAADFGVNAVIVNNGTDYQLLLTSEKTGVANSIEITVTDDDGSLIDGTGLSEFSFDATQKNMTDIAAEDAALTINGLAITSASNTVSSAIPGVTFNLKGETGAQPVSITVSKDTGAVSSAVNAFVNAYNSLNKQVKDLTNYDPETQQAGLLLGDSTVLSISSLLRNALSESADDSALAVQNLIDLGVSTNASGELELDAAALDAALDADFNDAVDALNDIGANVESKVASYLADNGLIAARTDGIDSRLDDIEEQRLRLDDRITRLQSRLVRQFSTLDTLLGRLQTTSTFLSQQLSSIPIPGQNNANG